MGTFLAEFDPAYHEWSETIALEWGEHELPDILAQLEDGEAELIIDHLYAEFVEMLPRTALMRDIRDARIRLHKLESKQQEAFPHRPVRYGSANTRERLATVQGV